MAAHNGWNSLGDVRELERKARRAELPELGRLALKLVADMDYLNGCVRRGRGSDIDPNHPGANVFGYIKEIEAKLNKKTDISRFDEIFDVVLSYECEPANRDTIKEVCKAVVEMMLG